MKMSVVFRESKDIAARDLKGSFFIEKKRKRFDKYDVKSSPSEFILRETRLKPLNNKKKLGSHRLSELCSFRYKFR